MSPDYSSQNFRHLEEIDPALAVLGTHAERYFVDDANTALIKTRQFAERLTQVLAEQSGTAFEQGESFADLLRKIRLDGAAPPEILDLLHRIRISGNDAVHGFDGERRLAFDAIKVCHRLGVWLRATITRSPGLAIAFHPPRAGGNEATDLRQRIVMLEEDLAARSTEAERAARDLARFQQVALDAEARARLAEEERGVYKELATEAESKAARVGSSGATTVFVKAAFESAREMDFGSCLGSGGNWQAA